METRPLRVIELFGGIGACSKALERIGIPHEVIDYVENDKYAVDSFNAIHGTNFEPQDITEWDKRYFCDNCRKPFTTGKFFEDDAEFYEDVCPFCGCYPTDTLRGNVDLIMHGSPCQDFSAAGLGKGGDEGSGTRSSLMYETIRIVENIRPKYVVWENVKNILSKKHKHNFDAYLARMRELGYTNYYQVLNAKNYGIPQNRERVYTISIYGGDGFEMPQGDDISNEIDRIGGMYGQTTRWGVYNQEGLAPTLTAAMGEGGGHVPMVTNFKFPEPEPLEIRLKDILEDEVDESFYLSDEQIAKIKMSTYNQNRTRIQEKDISQTLCARDWKDPKCVKVQRVGGMYDTETTTHQAGSVYDKDGLCPTLSTMQGGNREPIIVDDTYANRDAREYESYSPALRSERSGLKVVEPFIAASRGRNPKNPSDRTTGCPTEQRLEPKLDGTTNTITTVQKDNYVVEPEFVTGAYQEFANEHGYVPDAFNPYNQTEVGDVAPTQTTQCGSTTSSATVLLKEEQPAYRVRKLTPKECWRLMGFDDQDYERAAKKNSKTQLYKQAGNSIVVNVLEKIFTNLLK